MGILKHAFQALKRFFQRRTQYPKQTRKHPAKISFHSPHIEQLEDRTLLSVSPALFDAVYAPRMSFIGDATGIAVVNSGSSANSPASFAQSLNTATLQSAGFAGGVVTAPTQVSMASYGAYTSSRPAVSQVVIIDGAVPNYDELIKSIVGYANWAPTNVSAAAAGSVYTSGPQLQVGRYGNTEVVVLDPNYDGIQQITDVLKNYQGLTSEQIVSHGRSGELQLGATTLNDDALQQYSGQIAAWGQALALGGDILLYGCDVAQDSSGAQFVNDLAQVTGADVAAYYRRRVEGGVGLIITEGTSPAHPAAANDAQVPRFHDEDALAGWAGVLKEVKAAGGFIFPQLWHVGLIGLNLGLIAGLYLRALGMEILIGWESTYLDAAQVQRLADVLLAPAALFTGLAVPEGMDPGTGEAAGA